MKIRERIQNRWSDIVYRVRKTEWRWYRKKKLCRLRNRDFMILASNCCGTFMYYDLGLPYLTPTVNLTININDLIKMALNLEWYMEQEIVEIKEEDGVCPAGMCGDIRINFVRYDSFEEGVQKWEELGTVTNWKEQFLKRRYMDDFDYVSFLNGNKC